MGWASRDILNGAAADAIIEQIGRDRFDSRSLELVNSGGISAAIPSDAYRQLLIYRSDWLEQSALKPPDSYETMIAFAEAVFDSAAVISGIVVPTESNLISTQQVFEHLAAANGCQIINDEGEVTILAEACQEALDFYLSIVSRFSPIGVQTDTSAQNAYLSGRTGMIVGAPDMLKKIAGLDSSAMPSCPECADDPTYLVRNSGIVTELSGGQTVQTGVDFAEIRYLGITSSAEIEAAAEFANFWFGQGYSQWLGIEPEKKVPMLRGTADQPNRFIQLWRTLPLANEQGSLTDFYGSAVVDALGASLAESERWGLDQGEGPLMARLHEELTLPVVLQEMLSGYFGSQQTLLEMHDRIIELIPGYEQ
jgi:multiple sugar transport system substrate-binding protein